MSAQEFNPNTEKLLNLAFDDPKFHSILNRLIAELPAEKRKHEGTFLGALESLDPDSARNLVCGKTVDLSKAVNKEK